MPGSIFGLSNAALVGESPLAYALDALEPFVGGSHIAHLPYAQVRGDHDHRALRGALGTIGATTHTVTDPGQAAPAISRADVVLVSGGNTFLLLRTLQSHRLTELIRGRVANGMTYIGISAGTNVLSPTIATTNSMPIVHIASPHALGLLPFQLNVHLPTRAPDPTHAGESRHERIREYVDLHQRPVLALHEGSWVQRTADRLTVRGRGGALFDRSGTRDLKDDTDLSALLHTSTPPPNTHKDHTC
ncbi:dipeptidase PepE [Streptomyces sp. NPDC001508]|uniref:dipeptidase PepE n=1 Tax=Streptomyces sp. NPDC001508 TaxID=3154656 RepID=UPI0033212A29